MSEQLRKCTVDGKAMYFHRWSDESWIVPPSPMIGGHQGGVVQGTFAIVEDAETGEISKALPGSVKFDKEPCESGFVKRYEVMQICERYSQHCFEVNDARGQEIADRIYDDVVKIGLEKDGKNDA